MGPKYKKIPSQKWTMDEWIQQKAVVALKIMLFCASKKYRNTKEVKCPSRDTPILMPNVRKVQQNLLSGLCFVALCFSRHKSTISKTFHKYFVIISEIHDMCCLMPNKTRKKRPMGSNKKCYLYADHFL